MLATVATVTLAADYCPRRSEGFSFAVMMSLINLATASGDIIGSFLFDHLFHQRLDPAHPGVGGVYRFAFVLVPLLRLGDKRQGVARECNARRWAGERPHRARRRRVSCGNRRAMPRRETHHRSVMIAAVEST